ncbi:M3 family oligoendopeptidase [Candidatus Neomarinimicrobiota bacterium]
MTKKELLKSSAIILYFVGFTLGQDLTSGLLKRSQIDEKYKWDTSDVYENIIDWESDFEWVEDNLKGYDKYRNNLNQSSNKLLKCLEFDESIMTKMSYLWLYAQLNRDVDNGNEKYQKMWSNYSTLETSVEVARSFIINEIKLMPETIIQEFIIDNEELILYQYFFEKIRKRNLKTVDNISEEHQIKILKLVENSYDLFGTLVYSELPFPIIKDDKGQDIQLNRSKSWGARSSEDREYRKRGYEQYYYTLGEYKGTLTKNLNNFIEGKIYLAKSKNYESALEASLDKNDIPIKVYKNLIQSLNENLSTFHRWIDIKKELLDLDTIYIYDTRVSIFPDIEKEYTWEEAQDLTYESLAIMGDDYLDIIKKAYNNRWIDAFPNVGKETGGYSSGAGGPHPYVKMNWGGKLLDYYTLVHELGHYVHAYKSMQTQPFIYQEYPPFTAEVASTTAEMISQFYLIENSSSANEKLYHIEKYLDNIFLYLHSSALMAEFELMMYQLVESGESLSADDLSEMYGNLIIKYFGDEVTITDADKLSWIEWPHYYLDYYLYTYGTSFSASLQIASEILDEGEIAIKRFNTILETGGSDYPINILLNAGIDLTISKPYNAVSHKMNELMDEFELIYKNEIK